MSCHPSWANDSQEADAKKTVFLAAVSKLNFRQEEEKRRMVEQSSKGASGGGGEKGGGKGGNSGNWSSDEMALLIKAVNLFPAGEKNCFHIFTDTAFQHIAMKFDTIASFFKSAIQKR